MLNLLPPNKKDALRSGIIMSYVQMMLFALLIVAALVSGAALSFRFMLDSTLADLTQRTALSANGAKVSDIAQINSFLRRFEALQSRFVPWSSVLTQIAEAMPEKTVLKDLRIEKSGRIVMSGIAEDRDDVLNLQRRLRALPFVSDITSPISNILQKKNVKFDFEMKYNSK